MDMTAQSIFLPKNENGQYSERPIPHESSASFFLFEAIDWISSTLPSLPYSAKLVRQDLIPNHQRDITKTEPQRLLGLRGDDGMFACRLADGWSTIPEIKENWRQAAATRTILRLNNITIFRKTPTDHSLNASMIGPNHYFGVLDNTHKYLCTIQPSPNGIPVLVEEGGHEQSLPTKSIPNGYRSINDHAFWLSGKQSDNLPVIGTEKAEIRQKQSLTNELGLLIFVTEDEVITLPRFNAHQFDLSPFGAKLVKNNQPFRITNSKEDAMDAVSYHFGSDYAEMLVQEREGLFLETHDFTQIMSPMTKDSGGFITLGRWEKGKLELIGVEVPYGYSIIVSKGAIHGDSTFTGSYLMAMTVNHITMATADVVFLKNQNRKNLMLKLDVGGSQQASGNALSSVSPSQDHGVRYNDRIIKPLVVVAGGPLKEGFDDDIRSQRRPLDEVVRTGSSIVYNPANEADQYLRDIK